MRPRSVIIRLLLAAYPSAWSVEYGSELIAILLRRPLSTLSLWNVMCGAAVQRWRYASVWKRGGFVLMLWLFIKMTVNSFHPLPPRIYNSPIWYVDSLILLSVGYRAVRENVSPAAATVKAALLGSVPEFLLHIAWCSGILRPTVIDLDGSVIQHGSWITEFCSRGQVGPWDVLVFSFLITTVVGLVHGRVGGLIARTVDAFWLGYRGPAATP